MRSRNQRATALTVAQTAFYVHRSGGKHRAATEHIGSCCKSSRSDARSTFSILQLPLFRSRDEALCVSMRRLTSRTRPSHAPSALSDSHRFEEALKPTACDEGLHRCNSRRKHLPFSRAFTDRGISQHPIAATFPLLYSRFWQQGFHRVRFLVEPPRCPRKQRRGQKRKMNDAAGKGTVRAR